MCSRYVCSNGELQKLLRGILDEKSVEAGAKLGGDGNESANLPEGIIQRRIHDHVVRELGIIGTKGGPPNSISNMRILRAPPVHTLARDAHKIVLPPTINSGASTGAKWRLHRPMVCSPFDDIEIRKFQVAVEAIKCVLGLEATVHDVERVQVFQCQHYFSGKAVAHTAERNLRQSAHLTADNKQTHVRHISRDIPGYLVMSVYYRSRGRARTCSHASRVTRSWGRARAR